MTKDDEDEAKIAVRDDARYEASPETSAQAPRSPWFQTLHINLFGQLKIYDHAAHASG